MRPLSMLLLILPLSILCSENEYTDAIVKKIDTRQKPGAWILEVQKNVAYHYYGDQDAKPEYQELGKEAQSLLTIPEEKHVSIKKMAPHAPNFEYAPACMCNGYIFVKEEFMDRAWLGIKRVSLIHEAVHKKQFRPFEQQVIILNPSKYSKIEQEADFEGALLGKCYRCTYEFSLKQPREKDTSPQAQKAREMGYATYEQLGKISQQQQKQKLLCCQHKRCGWAKEIDEEKVYRKFYPQTKNSETLNFKKD
jgi:hypothetical protein